MNHDESCPQGAFFRIESRGIPPECECEKEPIVKRVPKPRPKENQ